MSKAYSLDICVYALFALSSERDLRTRVLSAITEMKVLKHEEGLSGDISRNHLKIIEKIEGNFLKIHKDDLDGLKSIARDLIFVCVEIIQMNSKK